MSKQSICTVVRTGNRSGKSRESVSGLQQPWMSVAAYGLNIDGVYRHTRFKLGNLYTPHLVRMLHLFGSIYVSHIIYFSNFLTT